MGRGKGKMGLIEKPASRVQTFRKRKEGLMKKLSELTVLCDIHACMVIYQPTLRQPIVWPPPTDKPDEARRVIETFNSKMVADPISVKRCGVTEFLEEQKKKKEVELLKLRKNNFDTKFPTSSKCFDFMNVAELRNFSAALHNKAMMVRSRIHEMMRMREMHMHDFEMKNVMMLRNSAYNNYNNHQLIHHPHYPSDHMGSSSSSSMNNMQIVPHHEGYFFAGAARQPPPLLQANNPYVANTADINMHAQAQAQQLWAYAKATNNMQAYPYANIMEMEDQKMVSYGGGGGGGGGDAIGDDMAAQYFLQFNP